MVKAEKIAGKCLTVEELNEYLTMLRKQGVISCSLGDLFSVTLGPVPDSLIKDEPILNTPEKVDLERRAHEERLAALARAYGVGGGEDESDPGF